MGSGFLDIQAAAKFLCRSPRWIRGKVGEIPHYRPGGQIIFLETDLLRYMERFKVTPEPVDLKGLMERVVGPKKRRVPGARKDPVSTLRRNDG